MLKLVIQKIMLTSFIIVFLFYLSYFFILYLYHKNEQSEDKHLELNYPFVTLIVPVYNEEKTISYKIKNIEELIYPKDKMEVIFVDGCSTDNTPFIISQIKNTNKFIKLIKQKRRGGYNTGIFEGIINSKGEVILVTDAGSYYYPDAIKHLIKPFNDCEIGAVTGKEIVHIGKNHYFGPKLEAIYRTFYDFMRLAETRIDSTLDSKGEILAIRKDICMNVLHKLECSPNACFDSCIPYQAKLDGYRTIFEPRAMYYEYAPATFMDRMRQQIRRASLLIGSMFLYKNMLFKKKYGLFSLIIIPAHFIMLIILPWLVLLGLILFPISSVINSLWLILLSIPLTALLFEKSRIFVISFIQSQIALVVAIFNVITRNGSLYIDTIPSTRRQ